MRLDITLAGDVTIASGDSGQRQVLTGPPRIVLAALALERSGGVPRDRLAGIVWPEDMPRTWASALRTHVSRVRTLISAAVGGAGETIVSGEAGYQIVLPDEVTVVVDVEEAGRELAAAREVLATDPAATERRAARAADLLRAPFLAGHPGSWADEQRHRLHDQLVAALELASEAAVRAGDGAGAVAAANDAVQQAPLRESAHRTLMAALVAAGNRAEALRAYQRLRRVLADEMGIDPSPETDAAYLDLLGPAPRARPVRSPAAAPGAAGAGRGAVATTVPFVGREGELAALGAAWELAAGGARHLVVVTGEAGIGKTRLTTEAARRVHAEGGLVLFGRCDQEAIVPYQPLVEALDGLVAATPSDELPFLGDEAMAELTAVLPSLDGPRRSSGPNRARLFSAVTELVAAVAKARPLLLVLDDLQWADDDTLLLIRHLLRRAGDAPVLVVAISRDHDLEPGHALADVVHALDRDGWVRRLSLQGLGESDVRTLLDRVHGPGDHLRAARRLVAETAGNPFLVTELVRAGASATSPGGQDIPPGVHDLVSARLARLHPRAADLLRAGAVAGARFDLDIAGSAAGLAGDDLLDAVDAALASGLVTEDSADRYRFPHDIVRRTLVAQLSGARRRALHRRTADAIERLRAHDLDAHVAVLAHHSSAGADPAGDERAVRWARRASARAAQRSAPAEAVRLCRQAQAHIPPRADGLHAEVTTELGIALLAAGDDTGAPTLARGAALARRHGRPDVVGRAALALADAAADRPDLRADARELVAAALTDLESGSARGPHAPLDHARLLVRRIRLGTPALGGPAPPGETLAALQAEIEALADPRAVDERQRLADELATLAGAAENAGGDGSRFRLVAAHEQAMAAALLGDDDAVRVALTAVEALATAPGADGLATALLAERRVARLTTEGHFDKARRALDDAVAAVAAHRGVAGPDGAEAVARRHRTVIDWLTGRPAAPAARHHLLPEGPERLHELGLAALAACDRGDEAAAAEVRALLSPFADLVCGVGYRSFAGAAAFHLGRLAAVAGDWADAERHLLSSLRLHSAWRARPWVALTQSALAGVLASRGRPSDREWIAGLRAEAAWVSGNLGLRAL